jgi:hypothetical protein
MFIKSGLRSCSTFWYHSLLTLWYQIVWKYMSKPHLYFHHPCLFSLCILLVLIFTHYTLNSFQMFQTISRVFLYIYVTVLCMFVWLLQSRPLSFFLLLLYWSKCDHLSCYSQLTVSIYLWWSEYPHAPNWLPRWVPTIRVVYHRTSTQEVLVSPWNRHFCVCDVTKESFLLFLR